MDTNQPFLAPKPSISQIRSLIFPPEIHTALARWISRPARVDCHNISHVSSYGLTMSLFYAHIIYIYISISISIYIMSMKYSHSWSICYINPIQFPKNQTFQWFSTRFPMVSSKKVMVFQPQLRSRRGPSGCCNSSAVIQFSLSSRPSCFSILGGSTGSSGYDIHSSPWVKSPCY